ncbi:flavin monoamine oxidase family protein [Aliivibrio fischeri]|uniref:flavin monoamine oxidase family protein n=1 Tax=Aliivibrio fischeri TaxID=668 RepID=UPI0007C4BAD2|nr:FAD-dependent oxidoreductase [Aliivibrio fischeri]
MKTDYLIIGAGLSGLYLAYQLEKMGKKYQVIESRQRIGGRILSLDSMDMGPSWFWPQMHPRITQLIDGLELPIFPQYSQGAYLLENQPNSAPIRYESGFEQSPVSMRIAGGMQSLIEALFNLLPSDHIQLDSKATHVNYKQNGYSDITVSQNKRKQIIETKHVIFAMPLRLLSERITFNPSLPTDVKKHFASTPTWMAGQAKFFAEYDTPFWRKNGLSGSASSHIGPLVEIHDASTFEGSGALFGFVGIDASTRIKAGEARIKQAAIEQLSRIFGEQAAFPTDIKLLDWSQEANTATQADHQAPRSHPSYGLPTAARKLRQLHWHFAGTEAAEENGGYLEGALEAADAIINTFDCN